MRDDDRPPPSDRHGRDRSERDRGDRYRDRSDRGNRERDRGDRDRDRDRDRRYGGRDADVERERGGRGERDRGDNDRRGDRDRDREHRDRHRARHRSRSRSRSRSRGRSSRSRTPPRRKRKTLFDVPPPAGSQLPQGFPAAGAGAPQAAAAMPMVPTAVVPLGGTSFGGVLPGAVPNTAMIQPPSQQATRHARRVYVGGLPPTANEQSIATFFSHALAAVGGTSSGPGNAVVNVYINREKNFAFVEFRTVEETSNAMALDGIMFEGVSVRVRRPNDYNPAAAAALGPSVPNPNLNLAAIGLQPGGASITDAHERVFVGGLPYYLTEENCRELLGTFGAIKSFDLVKDRETGNSKGYGFVVYADPSVTDIACQGLNGLKMGDRVLTVRRATEGQPRPDTSQVAQTASITSLSGATRVVSLAEAVTLEELQSDEDYKEILEDMQEECSKYGVCTNIVIPRPIPGAQMQPPGVGKVIIEFSDVNAAVKARNAMHGRKFGGRTVVAAFLLEEKFAAGQYE
ncbi:unnamed protein product [Ostreobium quekettii]|uniref:Splicing factor U2af large subunit n=1 Tax=Ostreobium quekettii TaxID=121088 RepID=A0A8S1IR12_9CHLO|nr:unnamed protein product [Ostreobium quekettii]